MTESSTVTSFHARRNHWSEHELRHLMRDEVVRHASAQPPASTPVSEERLRVLIREEIVTHLHQQREQGLWRVLVRKWQAFAHIWGLRPQ